MKRANIRKRALRRIEQFRQGLSMDNSGEYQLLKIIKASGFQTAIISCRWGFVILQNRKGWKVEEVYLTNQEAYVIAEKLLKDNVYSYALDKLAIETETYT
jgi:3-deoxy-D-manno-octulosonate 8-phosphate phosphatase KdsC-like HAD superfamily phosphatase